MERERILLAVTAKSGKAKVTRLEIPDMLKKYNSDNNTLRVRLVCVWDTGENEDSQDSCAELLQQTVGGQEFGQIANLDSFDATQVPAWYQGDWPYKENTPQNKIDAYKLRVLNKFFTGTRYTCSVEALCADLGGEYATITRVHSVEKKRTYPTLSDCTLSPASDDEKVAAFMRLQAQLVKRLGDNRLRVGAYVPNNLQNNIQSNGGTISNDIKI